MDTIHAWGSFSLVWACPDCDFERLREPNDPIPKDPDERTAYCECPDCGSQLVASVAMETHAVYPVETIEQLKQSGVSPV
jgi:predicted RNA-binding Zn-ribbon protein involved in translation (DUF1610 family)